jgi:hypothetical protein
MGKNPEDLNLESVEAMQWVLSTCTSVMIRVIENISHSTAKINDNCIRHGGILSAITPKLNVSGHMLIWIFFLV